MDGPTVLRCTKQGLLLVRCDVCEKETELPAELTLALVTSSPKLLAALEGILNSVPFHDSHERVKQQALAAIAEAKGTPPADRAPIAGAPSA